MSSNVSVRVKKGGPLVDSHYVYVTLPPQRTGAKGDMTFRSKLFPSKAKARTAADQIRKASKSLVFNLTDPRWGLRKHGKQPKRYTGHRAAGVDRYIVTFYYFKQDGYTPSPDKHDYYGREGHVEGVEAVDWHVSQGHGPRATMKRITPDGRAPTYERKAKGSRRVSPGPKGRRSATGCVCPPKPRRNARRGGNRAPAHKPAWDDAFRAGFKAARKDLDDGKWYWAQTAYNRRKSVRKKHGSDWVEGYDAAQGADRGAYAMKHVRRAVTLGILPPNWWK